MKDNYASYGCDLLAAMFTGTQPDELLKYISLGLTILATLVSIFFSVYFGIKKAKSDDGKIDPEEAKEIADDATEQLETLKGEVESLTAQVKEKDEKLLKINAVLGNVFTEKEEGQE